MGRSRQFHRVLSRFPDQDRAEGRQTNRGLGYLNTVLGKDCGKTLMLRMAGIRMHQVVQLRTRRQRPTKHHGQDEQRSHQQAERVQPRFRGMKVHGATVLSLNIGQLARNSSLFASRLH